MVMEENRQFGYLNPCTDDTVIRQKSGQVVAGGAIGVHHAADPDGVHLHLRGGYVPQRHAAVV